MTKSEIALTRFDRLALMGMILVPSFLLFSALQQAPRFHAEYENMIKGSSEAVPSDTAVVIFHYSTLSALTWVAAATAIVASIRMNRSAAIAITAATVAVMSLATYLVQTSLCAPLLPVRSVGFDLRQ